MGQVLSKYQKFWTDFAIQFGSGIVLYTVILLAIYLKRCKYSQRNTNLKFTSNFAGIVNGVICSMCCFTNLYRLKYWNVENEMIYGEQYNVPFYCALLMGYSLVDTMFMLYFIVKYDKNTIERRYDMIAHHVFILLLYPLMNFPKPIYFHSVYGIGIGVEVSSTFLNIQWFVTHYKLSKRKQSFSKLLFIISWFAARVPATVFAVFVVIKYCKSIINTLPVRVIIMAFFLAFSNMFMNGIWTIMIIKKIFSAIFTNFKKDISLLTLKKRCQTKKEI
eukprot:78470_1